MKQNNKNLLSTMALGTCVFLSYACTNNNGQTLNNSNVRKTASLESAGLSLETAMKVDNEARNFTPLGNISKDSAIKKSQLNLISFTSAARSNYFSTSQKTMILNEQLSYISAYINANTVNSPVTRMLLNRELENVKDLVKAKEFNSAAALAEERFNHYLTFAKGVGY